MPKRKWEGNILDNIHSVTVTKDELWQIVGDAQDLKKEESSFEAGMYLIAKRHPGNFQKATAIMFRMQALVRLLKEEGLPGWTLPRQPDGSIPTAEAVFATAAVQPLIERDNDLAFEREPFLKKVLELAEPEGEA